MKTCFKCGRRLSLDEFYVHKKMADGHLGKCKDCARRDVAARAEAKRDEIREYDRKRNRQPHRIEKIKRWYTANPMRAMRERAVRDASPRLRQAT